ncbi:4-hydroxy-tetrahydrodipicolinate reductase [Myxococcota bacterium]|nr:4-hydroxy-tetrahydrodipicolinate reductase [Myxococcota bacterium]
MSRGDPPAVRVAVHGAGGRMGGRLVRLIGEDPGLVLAGGLGRGDDLPAALRGADVVVDFSSPDGTARVCEAAQGLRIPAVVGTTGLDPRGRAAVEALAARAPVVLAPNTSAGVHVLLRLAALAARLLGEGYDAEIVEVHHRGKADAPSGTALLLARALAEAAGGSLEDRAVCHREGRTGPRPPGSVGVQALRGGDVVGEHTVLLLGDGERLELTHRCTDRDVFARGALRAARWVAEPGRPPGLYGMEDVLGPRA